MTRLLRLENLRHFDWRKLRWKAWPLAAKLTLTMTATLVLAVAVITLLSVNREQQTFQTELQQQADLLLDSLEVASSDALYLLDVDYLKRLMKELGQAEVVEAGRFYDANGRVVADSASSAVVVFDLESDPFGEELLASDSTVFRWESDHLLAGRAVVVGGQPIGAISVALPTASLQAKMADARNRGIGVGLAGAFLGTLLSLVLSRTITEPLRRLTEATNRVASGDMKQEIAIDSGDELAVLANAFNSMTSQVRANVDKLIGVNKELATAREKAEEASRLKSQFLATMSHELRTPLNAVIGYADLMMTGMLGPLDRKQQDYLERILGNGERLLGLINEILDLSKIEAGQFELVVKPFSPRDLLHHVEMRMQVLAEEKGLHLKTLVEPDLPVSLTGDPARVEQILVNLVGNAIKFTDAGEVDVRFEHANNGQWTLSVRDTGIGIPPHALEFIFDEFRQVDGTQRRTYGGSGLGLSIVRKLTLLMGGTVHVQSEPGKGSTFRVQLPLAASVSHMVL